MSETVEKEKKSKFTPGMSVGEAMALHPEVAIVFSTYHLGGCSHCAINELETIEQVCKAYGVPLDQLIESLSNLLED